MSSKGAGAPLKEIEIINNEKGAPIVTVCSSLPTSLTLPTSSVEEDERALIQNQLHGDAAAAAKQAGVKEISISISHSDSQAIAIAVATF